jgi:hypothetical protein
LDDNIENDEMDRAAIFSAGKSNEYEIWEGKAEGRVLLDNEY